MSPLQRGPLITLVTVLIAAAVGMAVLMGMVTRAPGERRGDTVRLAVSQGEAFIRVVTRLQQNGLVSSPLALRIYARLFRKDRSVQSGTYEFAVGDKPVDILDRLVAGDILKALVTIPEGFTIWDIAGAVGSAGIDSLTFLDAASDPERRARVGADAPTLEGYLFPDTYQIPWEMAAGALVDHMVNRTEVVFDDDMRARARALGLSEHEVLTLASIIEAECRVPEERATVSAVYHNRLKRRMRLEADPTVAYAMGGYHGRLLYADLEIESPYNTYRNHGLPPGPICNAGLAALEAALYPDSTSRALYFVARGDGSHIFSVTLKQHRENVRSVRANP